MRHNPYFNRWFSAMSKGVTLLQTLNCRHNPYFNRWFSAIKELNNIRKGYYCHNPYFNRWFSAMSVKGKKILVSIILSQSLF